MSIYTSILWRARLTLRWRIEVAYSKFQPGLNLGASSRCSSTSVSSPGPLAGGPLVYTLRFLYLCLSSTPTRRPEHARRCYVQLFRRISCTPRGSTTYVMHVAVPRLCSFAEVCVSQPSLTRELGALSCFSDQWLYGPRQGGGVTG